MGTWVLNYGHSPVSSLRVEYSTMDTLGWAHGQLSIELWTLSNGLMGTWVFNYGHSRVSSWRVEYSTADTLRWAHGHLSIQLRTLSGGLMGTWVFNYGHSWVSSRSIRIIDNWAFDYYIVKFLQYSSSPSSITLSNSNDSRKPPENSGKLRNTLEHSGLPFAHLVTLTWLYLGLKMVIFLNFYRHSHIRCYNGTFKFPCTDSESPQKTSPDTSWTIPNGAGHISWFLQV
jgi:hypothetical protein